VDDDGDKRLFRFSFTLFNGISSMFKEVDEEVERDAEVELESEVVLDFIFTISAM